MQDAAGAAANDRGNPGDGGYARNSVQLPPGAKVAYHDPKDIEAMPNFKYSLDGSIPKITSGGWAKESTEHQLPVSKGIAGVHMYLNPGASRELHWHAIAAEWAFIIDGRCQRRPRRAALYAFRPPSVREIGPATLCPVFGGSLQRTWYAIRPLRFPSGGAAACSRMADHLTAPPVMPLMKRSKKRL
jgi:hypothetical protein